VLNSVFDSQIAGGKHCDLATLGRRAANAMVFESHATDKLNQLIFDPDLTPLVADEMKEIVVIVCGFIDRFKAEDKMKLHQRLGN